MGTNINSTTYYLSQYTNFESAVFVFTLVVIMLVSLAGGLIMLYVLYSNDKMWTSTNMLIGNLALASTSVAAFVMPFSIYSAGNRKWTFGQGAVCKLTGFAASFLLLATIFTHTVISIDKFFAVVKPMSRAMTTKRTALLIAAVWVIAGVMSVAPLAGISRFEYNPTTLMCGIGFPITKLDLLYMLFLSGLGFMLPLILMGILYIRVYFAVKQHSARLLAHSVSSTDVLALQKRLIFTVFASLVCFLICWSTFFTLVISSVIIKDRSKLPRGLGIAAYWTGYFNSALNPIIICSLSNRFKEGFKDILVRFCSLFNVSCRRRSRHFIKNGSVLQSACTEVVFYENATLKGYSKKNSKGQIEADHVALTLCLPTYMQHDVNYCSSNSDNSHSSCNANTSEV
ncbi:octopamine receptor Oamb-like [Rhopilema esculentum]|uniref:octopamine receptor Oamb-like n=1 Tax=Rhopilema esculentum TaxID=499914 RepID=UPI0031CF2892|eukprot:gene14773-5880_t